MKHLLYTQMLTYRMYLLLPEPFPFTSKIKKRTTLVSELFTLAPEPYIVKLDIFMISLSSIIDSYTDEPQGVIFQGLVSCIYPFLENWKV